MKKLPVVEVVMGAVLLISIIGFYALQHNGDSNAENSTIVSTQNNGENGNQLDSGGKSYTMPVYNGKSDSIGTLAEKMDYYSKKVYITQENFLNQQYANIGDTAYCAARISNSLNYTTVSAKITNIEVTKKINDEYMRCIETKVKDSGKYGSKEWNCFIRNHANMSAAVTKEMAESISSYVIVDIVLNNYTDNDLKISMSDLKMAVVEDNGLISWGTYSEAANSDYVSMGATGDNCIILDKDKQVDYVGRINNGSGDTVDYHEPDASLALFGSNVFYLDQGELKLKLLYIITDKELATGKVYFCGWGGTEGNSNSVSRKYINTGIRIRIN